MLPTDGDFDSWIATSSGTPKYAEVFPPFAHFTVKVPDKASSPSQPMLETIDEKTSRCQLGIEAQLCKMPKKFFGFFLIDKRRFFFVNEMP